MQNKPHHYRKKANKMEPRENVAETSRYDDVQCVLISGFWPLDLARVCECAVVYMDALKCLNGH